MCYVCGWGLPGWCINPIGLAMAALQRMQVGVY